CTQSSRPSMMVSLLGGPPGTLAVVHVLPPILGRWRGTGYGPPLPPNPGGVARASARRWPGGVKREWMELSMLVNWHAHAEPPEQVTAAPWYGRATATIENLLRNHEEAGFDLAVVSNPVHYVKGKSPAEALPFIQRANEYAAEVQQRHPGRTVAFA